MREYETTFIVQPEISDEGSQAILSKLDGVLDAGSSTRLMCEDHGKRKLAYEIRKFHKGHYYTLQFLDDGAVVPDIERALRLEESVLRFLTILVTEEVEDVEGRKTVAAEAEVEQQKRAAERAQREAEEAAARREQEEAERQAAAEAAAAAATAGEAAEGEGDGDGEGEGEAAPAAEAPSEEPAAPAEETPAADEEKQS
ncbi:MAG: 30S ribosomal protein S6 [bacterium]|nr:30S ribosomal protein S6 [bacterium]